MATLVLGAAGASIGGAIGGSFLGVTGAALGQAVGATIGSVIDQSWMTPAQSFERGRIDQYRLQTGAEGGAIPLVFGRMRVPGQMMWRDVFVEHVNTTTGGGGKGGGPKVSTKDYSYTVNVAFALCEGVISRVGRIWADGEELPHDQLDFSVYLGNQDQLPDDTIEAVEGSGNVPAFRGTAYIVLRDLDVTQFGNRIPQFNFEVFRPAQPETKALSAADTLNAVCMIPGSGEFVYGTTPVYYQKGSGSEQTTNSFARVGSGDITASIAQLKAEMPNVSCVSLVVTWFGDDLNCGNCNVAPGVESSATGSRPYQWSVAGRSRSQVHQISKVDGKPAYGGTLADRSVIEAIQELKAAGYEVVLYPFVMMDIASGAVANDPYGAEYQAAYPWRGLLTSQNDKTDFVTNNVSAFFGDSAVSDFSTNGSSVNFSGNFDYRALVLHYANLASVAGGVDGFLIGSELRGLTRLRDLNDNFPAVDALKVLAADVRTIVGPSAKIGYAAGWYPPEKTGSSHLKISKMPKGIKKRKKSLILHVWESREQKKK